VSPRAKGVELRLLFFRDLSLSGLSMSSIDGFLTSSLSVSPSARKAGASVVGGVFWGCHGLCGGCNCN